MRASAPNGFIPWVWDANNDVFDSNQLVANWDAIDNQLGQPRSANQITQVGSLPTSYNNTTSPQRIRDTRSAQFSDGQVARGKISVASNSYPRYRRRISLMVVWFFSRLLLVDLARGRSFDI
jgi:hypothetical protein